MKVSLKINCSEKMKLTLQMTLHLLRVSESLFNRQYLDYYVKNNPTVVTGWSPVWFSSIGAHALCISPTWEGEGAKLGNGSKLLNKVSGPSNLSSMWWNSTADSMWWVSLPAFLLRGEMQGVTKDIVLKMLEPRHQSSCNTLESGSLLPCILSTNLLMNISL